MPLPLGLLAGASGLLGASGPSPYPVGLGQVLGAGLQQYLQYLPMEEEEKRRQGMQRTLEEISRVVAGAATKASAAGPGVVTRPAGGAGGRGTRAPTGTTYYDRIKASESGGRNIGSKTSSAFGPYQFINGTWEDLIARHPELGLTSEDRMRPEAQELAIRAHTADNAATLQQRLGRAPTLAELNTAHKLGADGALQALGADPATPLGKVIGDKALQANPAWRNLNVGQFLSLMGQQVGGGTGPALDALGGAPAGGDPTPTGGSTRDLLMQLYGPQTEGPRGLDAIDPQTAQILSLALQSPDLAPAALQATLQLATGGGRGGRGRGPDIPADIQTLLLAGIDPSSPQGQQWLAAKFGAAPKAEEQPGLVREAQFLYPGDPEGQRRFVEAARTRPLSTVSVTGEQESEFGKGVGKATAGRYEAIQAAAGSAIERLQQLDQFEALLSSGVTTGPGAPTVARISSIADAVLGSGTAERLGLPNAGPAGALQALGNQFALILRNPASGAGLPGAVSDRDLQFLKEAIPGLENSPAGNKLIIEGMRRLAQRQVDLARVSDDYLAEVAAAGEKPTPAGFNARIRQFAQENPLFGDDFKASAEAIKAEPQPNVLGAGAPAAALPSPAAVSSMSLDDLHALVNANPALLSDPKYAPVIEAKLGRRRGATVGY